MAVRFSGVVALSLSATLLLCACGATSTESVTGPDADKCQVALTAPGAALEAAGGISAVAITTQPECAWTASADASWITEVTPAQGQGSGRVEFRAAPNPIGIARESAIVVNGQRATVRQSAAACTIAAVSSATQFSSAGGNGTITVTAPGGCGWTVTAMQPWIAVAAASGTGTGTVNFTVAANTGGSRTATVIAGGATITINQAGATAPAPSPQPPATCSTTLQPVSAAIPAAGGTGSVSITVATGCSWTAASGASWITLTTPVSGTGNGSVGYSVAANASTTARSGSITIGGASFPVNQAGAAPTTCTVTINPATRNFGKNGGNGSIAVSAGGCGWMAVSNAAWITITAGASGTGNGTVTYAVADFDGNGMRSGTISIAGQTFTITQKN